MRHSSTASPRPRWAGFPPSSRRRPWPALLRTVYGDPERMKKNYFETYPGLYYTGDGCRIVRHVYGGCSGADTVLCEIKGGGHTWPGGPQYLPVSIIGRTCRDFDATERIWDFFKIHEKK